MAKKQITDNRELQGKVTIVAEQMPLPAFLQYLAAKGDFSIVYDESLEDRTVTINVRNQRVGDILSIVARRLGADVSRTGNLYFVGKLRPEDRGVLVRRVRRMSQSEVGSTTGILLSKDGRQVTLSDSILVVADRVSILAKLHEMIDLVELQPSITWSVQIHIITMSDSALRDLGIDGEPALEMAATLSSASAVGLGSFPIATKIDGSFDAILRAVDSLEESKIVAQPMYLLRDGSSSRFDRGSVIPVPRTTTSQQGQVSTTEFIDVQTGLGVEVEAREISDTSMRLRIDIDLSEVESIKDGAPTLRNEKFKTEVDVASGGVYLVGSLRRLSKSSSLLSALQFGKKESYRNERIYIFARAYRIQLDTGASTGG